MVSMLAGAAASAGFGVFSYNRKNFMFDGKMVLEREYQGQSMRIKRFNLYREDIRDLVELTVAKMDNYLIVNTIQLMMALVLFTEGKPHTDGWPERICWLYTLCNGGAVVYFILSVWLAMHASIAAHSFGVRLLTQFVRLPVPNRQQLDAARAQAMDWEMKGGKDMFRVPVVQQQATRIKGEVMERLRNDLGGNGNSTEEASGPDAQAHAEDQASGVIDPDEDPLTPAVLLRHIQIYRELQANWIGYDAYARVCMCMGANQFVHAVAYYTLGVMIVENRNPLGGFAAAVVLLCSTWLVLKLDIHVPTRKVVVAGTLFMLAPLLETISTTITVAKHVPQSVRSVSDYLMIPVFTIHIIWLSFIVNLCRAEYCNGVALPKNFRSVTYLDVFGFLTPNETDQSVRSAVAAEEAVVGQDRRDGPEGAVEPVSATPEMLESLQGECQKLCLELLRDAVRWDSEKVRAMLDERTSLTVTRLLARLRSAELGLQSTLDGAAHTGPTDEVASGNEKSWLRFEWQGAAEFYYCCETDELQWTKPQDQESDRISDILILQAMTGAFETKVQAYRSLVPTPSPSALAARRGVRSRLSDVTGRLARRFSRSGRRGSASPTTGSPPMSPTLGPASSSPPRSPNLRPASPDLPQQESSPDQASSPSGSFSLASTHSVSSLSAGSSAVYFMVDHDRDRSAAQVQAFGGPESVQTEMADPGFRNTFFSTGAQVAPSFYPRAPTAQTPAEVEREKRRRHPPGVVPYRTFCQASIGVIGIWVIGLVWTTLNFSGITIPWKWVPWKPEFKPHRNPPKAAHRPELLFDSAWPHPFFRPTGLACHPAAGSWALVASKFAVHEIDLDAHVLAPLRPALEECLAGDPDFHAAGIGDISLDCPAPSRDSCTAVLLSFSGERVLRCSLAGARGTPILLPRKHRWRALAAGQGPGSLWALGPTALLQLGLQPRAKGSADQLVPHSEISDAPVANLTRVHVLAATASNGGAVMALEAESHTFRAWPLRGGEAIVRTLPAVDAGKWAGLCSTGGFLYLASERLEQWPAGLWRLPALDV